MQSEKATQQLSIEPEKMNESREVSETVQVMDTSESVVDTVQETEPDSTQLPTDPTQLPTDSTQLPTDPTQPTEPTENALLNANPEPVPDAADQVLTPRDNPTSGLTEVEEVDNFGRVVHRTVSRATTLSVVTTFTDNTQPKAKILSLDGLLEYTEKDVSEKIFEVSLLAETFKDMILLRFARVIMQALTEAVETKMQIQNLAVVDESTVKEEPMEEGEIPKPPKKEEQKSVPAPVKVNRDLYVACQYFDKKNKGHLSQSDLLNILLNANLVCSRGEAEMLVNQIVDGGRFEYLKLFKNSSSLIVCSVNLLYDYQRLLDSSDYLVISQIRNTFVII